jgi:hypothetical protein
VKTNGGNNMIRSKLMKALLLGAGMAAFTTNIAFAQMVATTAGAAV